MELCGLGWREGFGSWPRLSAGQITSSLRYPAAAAAGQTQRRINPSKWSEVSAFNEQRQYFTRKPPLELAPTTFVQRTRQTTKNTSRRNVHPLARKRAVFFFLWPWTLTYGLDLWPWPVLGQGEFICQISRSKVTVRPHTHTGRLLYLVLYNR